MTFIVRDWSATPPPRGLPCDALPIHRIRLAGPPAGLAAALSEDERGRAERLHTAIDRHRFITARGAMRTILGRCLGEPAAALSFSLVVGATSQQTFAITGMVCSAVPVSTWSAIAKQRYPFASHLRISSVGSSTPSDRTVCV